MPYPVTRQSRSRTVLHQEETFLWPALLQDAEDACAVAAVGEIERVWPTRSTISSETWHALFNGATRQLDILVYAGAFLIETLDLADVLAWKASTGTQDPHPRRLTRTAPPCGCEQPSCRWTGFPGGAPAPCATCGRSAASPFDNTMRSTTRACSASTTSCWPTPTPRACGPATPQCCNCVEPAPAHLFDFYLRSFDRIWGPDR